MNELTCAHDFEREFAALKQEMSDIANEKRALVAKEEALSAQLGTLYRLYSQSGITYDDDAMNESLMGLMAQERDAPHSFLFDTLPTLESESNSASTETMPTTAKKAKAKTTKTTTKSDDVTEAVVKKTRVTKPKAASTTTARKPRKVTAKVSAVVDEEEVDVDATSDENSI